MNLVLVDPLQKQRKKQERELKRQQITARQESRKRE